MTSDHLTSLSVSTEKEVQELFGKDFSIDLPSQQLLDWLFTEQSCQGEGSIQVLRQAVVTKKRDGTTTTFYRRGLFATEDCPAGDYLFAIPLTAGLVIEEEETTDAERGLKLMQLKQESAVDRNKWARYFEALPTRDDQFDPTPDFWTEEQIRRLESPRLIESALSRKQRIKDLSEAENIPLEELQFATWLVESRSLTLLKEKETVSGVLDDDKTVQENGYYELDEDFDSTSVIIPIVDMINHSSDSPNAELDVLFYEDEDESKSGGGGTEENLGNGEAFYAIVATEDISAGSEIKISYGTGEDSSIEILHNYGFIPGNNPFDDLIVGIEGDCCFPPKHEWGTTLESDKDALKKSDGVDRTILQFRIAMKEKVPLPE